MGLQHHQFPGGEGGEGACLKGGVEKGGCRQEGGAGAVNCREELRGWRVGPGLACWGFLGRFAVRLALFEGI